MVAAPAQMRGEIVNSRLISAWLKTGLLCFCRASIRCALVLATPAWAANTFESVYISEFLAENRHTLKDNDGNYSGWIELHNGGSDVVNLAGWFLSDSPT